MSKYETVLFRLKLDEIEQVRHVASLNGLTVREYIVRAINQRMMSQGVDAVLLTERCDV